MEGTRKDSDLTPQGVSKVDHYRWKPLTDKPDLRWIDKAKIFIDHEYQRNANDKKAIEIAGNFSWPAFGALVVAERLDGTFMCTDGQHRLMGARRRSDVQEVPCIVFKAADIIVEAQAFLDGNTLRKPLTAIDKFRAKVMTGDEAALLVQKLVNDAGRMVHYDASVASAVACVSLLEKLARSNSDRLTKLWPLIMKLCEDGPVNHILVDALFYIEGKIDNDSILNTRWRTRLLDIGAKELIQGAQRAAAFYTRGGAKVWAIGMLEVLNKGLRKKLIIRGEPLAKNASEADAVMSDDPSVSDGNTALNNGSGAPIESQAER